MATLADASKMLTLFKKYQKAKGVSERGNVLQQKWNMRDIMMDIPSQEVEKLIRFYVDVDEEKTIDRFFQKYDQYYDVMLDTIAERRRSRNAVKKTMESIREQ